MKTLKNVDNYSNANGMFGTKHHSKLHKSKKLYGTGGIPHIDGYSNADANDIVTAQTITTDPSYTQNVNDTKNALSVAQNNLKTAQDTLASLQLNGIQGGGGAMKTLIDSSGSWLAARNRCKSGNRQCIDSNNAMFQQRQQEILALTTAIANQNGLITQFQNNLTSAQSAYDNATASKKAADKQTDNYNSTIVEQQQAIANETPEQRIQAQQQKDTTATNIAQITADTSNKKVMIIGIIALVAVVGGIYVFKE